MGGSSGSGESHRRLQGRLYIAEKARYYWGVSTKPSSKVAQLWSEELVSGIGFTPIPAIILERQEALGLEPVDLNIILQIAFHWRERERLPYPSKATLARRIGISPRTVQRRIAALESHGFIERRARTLRNGGNDSNEYSLSGLIEKARPFADEKRELIEKHEAEHEERRSRRRARPKGAR
jgi:DNA-binding HxlR family transcriptional regulator